MVSLEKIQTIPKSPEHNSSPRISFSSDFLDEENFISISPTPPRKPHLENTDKGKSRATDFEFLSNNNVPSSEKMITADELFFEGKLLPFWEIQHVEQLGRIRLGKSDTEKMEEEIFKKKENNNNNIICNSNNNNTNTNSNSNNNNGGRMWFIDDDPSPRPPKCTVLWKELLRLKKQRAAASSLSPSSSSSSSSTSSTAFGDLPMIEEGKEGSGKREKHVKRVKKGLERTRSASIRIRPMVNVPVCAQGKSNGGLAPLFSLKKGRLGR